jgi:hypothetical protein
MLISSPATGQEKIPVSDCVYVQFDRHVQRIHDEWLCADGTAYSHRANWTGPSSIAKVLPGESRCMFIKEEKAWLCPVIGKVLRGPDAPKVQVGK